MKTIEQHLKWCSKQSKGIKIVNDSINLQKAYLKKSENAIKSMDVNATASIDEWVVSTSYYAKYFAIYALLSRIGVKCEIHDCTLSVFEYLFSGEVPPTFIQNLQQSKGDRVGAQYYTGVIKINPSKLIADTKAVVLMIQEIINNLNQSKIIALQGKLRTALQ